MKLPVLLLIGALIVALFAYLKRLRGEMDGVSFYVAKFTLLALPSVFPKNETNDVQKWRKLLRLGSVSIWQKPNVSSVEQFYIDGDEANERRFLRLYNIGQGDAEQLRDVVIFYFPGAWILGGVDENDAMCRHLAIYTKFIVVSVQYSLAPEHPFPRGFNDAFTALRWVKRNIAAYGGNPDRIFISGESAGGNLAAAVTARNLDTDFVALEERANVIGLLLVYPPLAADFTTESYRIYDRFNGMLPAAVMRNAWDIYRANQAIEDGDYTYQPINTPAHILHQFPPTEFVVAEYDVLRDDSFNFATRLSIAGHRRIGVEVYNSTIHGFFGRDLFPHGISAVLKASHALLAISAETP